MEALAKYKYKLGWVTLLKDKLQIVDLKNGFHL